MTGGRRSDVGSGVNRVERDAAQSARFVAVTDEAGLDAAWARSFAGPVVLFNYDPG